MKTFRTRYQLDRYAWGMVLVALCCTLSLAYFVLAAVNDVRHRIAHQTLAAQLAQRDYTNAKHTLTNIINLPTGMATFDLWALRTYDMGPLTDGLWNLMVRISDQDYEKAADSFGVFINKNQELIFQILGPRALEDIKTALDNALRELTKQNSIEKQVALLDERRAYVVRQHSLVAKDLGEMMALPSSYSGNRTGEDVAARELEFYQRGVLAQLPIIKGIPDGLMDLTAFRDALEAADGHLTLGAGNADAAAAFQSAIAGLRDTSAGLISQEVFLKAQIDETQETLKDQAAILQKEFDRVQRRLSDLLIKLTAQNPVKEHRRAREQARQSSLDSRNSSSGGLSKYMRDLVEDTVRTITEFLHP